MGIFHRSSNQPGPVDLLETLRALEGDASKHLKLAHALEEMAKAEEELADAFSELGRLKEAEELLSQASLHYSLAATEVQFTTGKRQEELDHLIGQRSRI